MLVISTNGVINSYIFGQRTAYHDMIATIVHNSNGHTIMKYMQPLRGGICLNLSKVLDL